MALTLACDEWARARGASVMALTVDHGLRPESAGEAAQVARWLGPLGIAHHVLYWRGEKPAGNLQATAREARYALLTAYCRAHNIAFLLTAHHQEDQAETFLLRLARGSGVDGLAAMSACTGRDGVTLLRPLLDTPATELHAYLAARGQAFLSDPSNHNPAFDRVRLRQAAPALAALGLTAPRLAKTAATLARARAFLEAETAAQLANQCRLYAEGYVVWKPRKLHEELTLRMLAAVLRQVGGKTVRPRLDDLTRLHSAVFDASFTGATLHGVECRPWRGVLLFLRELQGISGPVGLRADETAIWDGRFHLTRAAGPDCDVAALDPARLGEIANGRPVKTRLPLKKILASLPAIYATDGRLLAVPHLGFFSAPGLCCTVAPASVATGFISPS